MKLEEKKDYFFIKDFFSDSITAGFTKVSVSGNLPFDFQAFLKYIGKESGFSYMNQKHSPQVFSVSQPGVYTADALFSRKKNSFLVVKTADCLPIFLAKQNRWVGVVHMGWRSAKEGILENIPFGLAGCQAVAGVGLRSCCYQVGDEFLGYSQFSPYLRPSSQGFFFDPIEFAKSELIRQGLPEDNFFDLGLCSFCSKHLFFSRRRDKTSSRTLSFIGIN